MRIRLQEQTILFISIIKWFVLSSIIGVIVGLSTTLFLLALNISVAVSSHYQYYFLALPAALFITIITIKYLAPEAEGHGTEKVIEAVHKRSGRIVTPIFFIGTSAGALFAQLLKLDIATFAAIGMISLLAGAANTPIAASIMAIEMFGPQVAPYAAVAAIISFLMTGNRSVYPSQILAVLKSPSIKVETGKVMKDLKITFQSRNKSLIGIISSIFKKRR